MEFYSNVSFILESHLLALANLCHKNIVKTFYFLGWAYRSTAQHLPGKREVMSDPWHKKYLTSSDWKALCLWACFHYNQHMTE